MFFNTNIYDQIEKKIIEEDKKSEIISDGVPKFVNEKALNRSVNSIMTKYNSIQTGVENKVLKEYISSLKATKGDYTKRSMRILDKVEYMTAFAGELIASDSNIRYSVIGLFYRAFKLLNSAFFINTMKKVYTASISKETEDIGSLYLMIYFSLAFFVENTTAYLVRYEMLYSLGNFPAKKVATDLTNEHKGFSKYIVMGIATLLPFLEKQKTTNSIVSSIQKKKEAYQYQDENKSKEVGLITVAAITTGIILGLFALYGLFYVIRNMFYWIAANQINNAKSLELDAEFLKNNIRALRKRLAETKDEKEISKLSSIIAKQEVYVEKWERTIKDTLGEEIKASYETEEEIDKEDSTTSAKEQSSDIKDIFL